MTRTSAAIRICVPALFLTACTGGLPSRDAAPAPRTSAPTGSSAVTSSATPSPTVSKDPTLLEPAEATKIVSQLRTIVTAERSSTQAVSPRIVGPFRERTLAVRLLRVGTAQDSSSGQSVRRPATGIDPDEVGHDVASPPSPQHLLLTRGATWPRWFLTAGSSGQGLPRLSVLLANRQGAPYGIWAQMLVLPGRSVPAVAPATQGAPLLGPGSTGLVATPTQVATRYADVLNRGSSSTHSSAFASDDFREQIREQLAADRKRMVRTQNGKEVSVGTVSATHTVRPGGVLALRTQNGGALIIASLRQTQVLRVTQKGGKLNPDPILSGLAGRSVFTKELTRICNEVLAFTVPKAGSGGKITLIAATKGDVKASGS